MRFYLAFTRHYCSCFVSSFLFVCDQTILNKDKAQIIYQWMKIYTYVVHVCQACARKSWNWARNARFISFNKIATLAVSNSLIKLKFIQEINAYTYSPSLCVRCLSPFLSIWNSYVIYNLLTGDGEFICFLCSKW